MEDARGLVGGFGVTLMEYHSTFKWREADNQSDVAAEFTSSQASTLSAAVINVIQHLNTVKHYLPCFMCIKESNQLSSGN